MEDSIYRLRHQDVLTLIVIALVGLGVLIVQSASMGVVPAKTDGAEKAALGWHWSELATKQVTFAVMGLAVFFVVRKIDYVRLVPRSGSIGFSPVVWLLIAALVTCVAVLIPHVGIEKNGARRWLPLGIMQLQPSELAKWAVVVFLAWWLTHRPVNLDRFSGFILTLVPVGALCLLVVIQDFGTAALIGVVAVAMMVTGRVKWWHLAVVIPPAMAGGIWFVTHTPYRMRRMMAFRDPFAAPQGEGYHMIQSLLSFATGRLTGTGLGSGVQKLGYLPEDTTDFIFAVICEELGLFGAAFVIVLYLGVLLVAWQAIKAQRDSFGRLLAFGIATMVCTQATINIAVATVSVPTKGLSLPLVSAGGSGLVITCAALGLLASIFEHYHATDRTPARKPVKNKPPTTPTVLDEATWQAMTTA